MDNFTEKMKRKFNALSKPKAFRSRPYLNRAAKLRQIQQVAEEELDSLAPFSSDSQASQVRPQNSLDYGQPLDSSGEHYHVGKTETETKTEIKALEQLAQGQVRVDDADAGLFAEETAFQKVEDAVESPSEPPTEETQLSAQAKRDSTYLIFYGEDETDYTEGPARMAWASDGVKDTCASLLMTLDLSQSIQRAIIAERGFAKAQRQAQQKRGAYSRFASELDAEMANHSLRLRRLNAEEDEAKKQSLQVELTNLERMLELNQTRRQRVVNDLEYKGRVLRDIQREANAVIEEAFICARLLDPEDDTPDTPIEDLDIQQEYREFTAPSNPGSSHTIVASQLDTSRDHKFVTHTEPTEEQRRKIDVRDAFFKASERLKTAQAAFDRRVEDRLADQCANETAATTGEPSTTQEEFDLRWFQKIQELTHELIEAESAFSAAKATAAEEGVEIQVGDQEFGFMDDPEDGYRLSQDQAMIDWAQQAPGIDEWMSGILEVASPSFNEQTEREDEWQADEVQTSDSISMVAWDAGDRKRIDKWRQVCGLE